MKKVICVTIALLCVSVSFNVCFASVESQRLDKMASVISNADYPEAVQNEMARINGFRNREDMARYLVKKGKLVYVPAFTDTEGFSYPSTYTKSDTCFYAVAVEAGVIE